MSLLLTAYVFTKSGVDVDTSTALLPPHKLIHREDNTSQCQRKPKGLTIFGLLKYVHQFLRDCLAPVHHNFTTAVANCMPCVRW